MPIAPWIAALVVATTAAPIATYQIPDQQVELAAVRFYRAGVGTIVEGLCRVPFGLLEPVRGGERPFGAYRINITVRDSAGLALTEQSWSQQVPMNLIGVSGASVVELFRFAVEAGTYDIEIGVVDSASGRVARTRGQVLAYEHGPMVSDLLLSASLRSAGDSAVAGSGEILRGGYLITAQTVPVLTPNQSELFYYLEVYPGTSGEAELVARIVDPNGRAVISAPPTRAQVGATGVAASGLNLAGLPPGDYEAQLDVRIGDRLVSRSAPFRMAGFATEAAIAQTVGGRAVDIFAHLTEDQLDTLYAPLVYLQEADERRVYGDLSVEGKRNYLRQFWDRRDPTPGTPANEQREQFYSMIAYANREYRESGAGDVPGWRTDRGRVYIRYGEPEEFLRRPASGPTPPYEVWKYTRGRPRKFVFLDETRLGNYVLIFTDERREPSLPDWEEILGPEATADVKRF